jgi:GNAT superfamily N-acetyltransferase
MITIRKAISSDADIIADFQQKMAFESEGLELNSVLISQGVAAVFDDKNKGEYFVAVNKENTPVASLLITYEWSDWRNTWIWWIQSVYVIPQYRRKGVFSEMYSFIRKKVEENPSVGGIRLYVEKENHDAQKTYAAVGMNGQHYNLFEWLK